MVDILAILDRSGSMESMQTEAVNGFNNFLDEQRAIPGDCQLTLFLFDDQIDLLYSQKDIKKVVNLDKTTYVPRGMTALYDAIAEGARHLLVLLGQDTRTPDDKVIVVVVTDGQENASKNTDLSKLKGIIEECKTKGWEFVFLASDPTSFQDAYAMGINSNAVYSYSTGTGGTLAAYNVMSSQVRAYRGQTPKDSTGN